MSSTIDNVKDLDASRTEALHGLLRSLGHGDNVPSSSATHSIALERIKEILRDGEGRDPKLGDQPSQILNEEGLPIVDISEPVSEDFETSTSSPPLLERELVSLSSLLPDERDRWRHERDRILDMLEEEERLQQLQAERDAEEERKDAIRKRKESARAELEQLKAARELQKKMGQALVRHAKEAGDDEEKEDVHSKPRTTPSVAKQRVSFAVASAVEADERDQVTSTHPPGWGDVIPGRLRMQRRIPLVSTDKTQKHPMKTHVVERHPTAIPPFHGIADSDDESTSSTGHFSPCSENDSSGAEDRTSSSIGDISDDEHLEEGLDYGVAQHHREIALEYHAKRHGISAETTKLMGAQTVHDKDDKESYPSDRQPPLSRFRADRMAATYDKLHGSVSTSTGQTIVPAFRQGSLRNSVKLGRLEDSSLMGGESGESGTEDETVREVIQMLRTGRIQNAGPDFAPSAIPIDTPQNFGAVESSTIGTSTAAHEGRPSRFRLARGGGIAETTTFQGNPGEENVQPKPAISGVVERKVPKSLPRQHFPLNRPSIQPPIKPIPPMIIDSPSFPSMPGASPSSSTYHTTTSSHTHVGC